VIRGYWYKQNIFVTIFGRAANYQIESGAVARLLKNKKELCYE